MVRVRNLVQKELPFEISDNTITAQGNEFEFDHVYGPES